MAGYVTLRASYPQGMPLAWTGSFRHRNRAFYTNLGHSIRTWTIPAFVDHVVAGALWAADAPVPQGCVSRGLP